MLYQKAKNAKGNHHTFKDRMGYVWATAPAGHPRASKFGVYKGEKNGTGYVKRAVLVLEYALGRQLDASESVHHINGVKDDDRPENLRPLLHAEHSKLHCHAHSPRRRIGAPVQGEPCAKCESVLGKWGGKRGLCNACYLKAKRCRQRHGAWPDYACLFKRTTGRD